MKKIPKELVESVDQTYLEADSDAQYYIRLFTDPALMMSDEAKDKKSKNWNGFIRDLKKRQKTVIETGRLVKGERNRLCDMLEGASYDWPEAESGLLIPVVDIYIMGYRATRKNDLGSYYSRTTPVSGKYAEIKGVECEILAIPDANDPNQLSDLGLGIVRTCAEVPEIFKGDEEHIFVPADRLISAPVKSAERNSYTGYS